MGLQPTARGQTTPNALAALVTMLLGLLYSVGLCVTQRGKLIDAPARLHTMADYPLTSQRCSKKG